MRRVILAVIVCACLAPRSAHADIGSEIFGDIKDVVEDLIQSEVTTSVVGTLKARSPALGFYMHGTLERLASPYWGSLGRTLKSDLTLLIADFVYWHMSSGGGDGDILGSAKRFFHCAVDQHGAPECVRMHDAIVGQNRSLLEVECRRVKPPPDRRVACDLGLAVHAALERRGGVRHHLLDALADIVLSELADRNLADRAREVLGKWLEFKADEQPTALFESLGNPDIQSGITDEAIDKLCKTDIVKTRGDLLNDPYASPAWICFAISHSDFWPSLGATVTVKGEPDATLPYWVLAAGLKDVDTDRIADDAALRVFVDLASDQGCTPTAATTCTTVHLAAGTPVSLAWLGRTYTGVAGANGALDMKASSPRLATTIHRFKKAMRRIDELRALVPAALQPYLFYPGAPDAKTRLVLRAVHRMARLVTELRARWYLWQADAKSGLDDLDIAELLHVARSSLGDQPPGSPAMKALAFLDQHATGAASLDIGDWLRFVMRGDYRSLAMESLRAALDIRLDDQKRPAETFFLTLASYLLDVGDGVDETVARSAFRASAKELLLSQTHKGVPRVGDRVRFNWLPRLGVRLSFDGAYAATDGDTRRNVVSAELPTLMFAITDYIGLELAAVDPVAPLAEMALRPAGTYHNQQAILLDALRPRLGLWMALPQLTRRVALTVGAGPRFLGATRNDDGSDPLHIDATYKAKTTLALDAGIEFVF